MTSTSNSPWPTPPAYLSDPALLEQLFRDRTLDDAHTSATRPQRNYGVMWSNCFIPATTAYLMHSCIPFSPDYPLANHFLIAGNCEYRRYKRRGIGLVRAGASKREVDDMLEYGLRLAAGTDGPINNNAAMRIFNDVFRGPFPNEKRAIAASLTAFLVLHSEAPGPKKNPEPEDMLRGVRLYQVAAHYCYESAKLGFFSYFCALIASSTSRTDLEDRDEDDDKGTDEKLTYLYDCYQEFRAETGYQPLKSHFCANCGVRRPYKLLQRCGGPCHQGRKPVYCGRICQKAHWKSHREWCVVSSINPIDISDDSIYCMHLASTDDKPPPTPSS